MEMATTCAKKLYIGSSECNEHCLYVELYNNKFHFRLNEVLKWNFFIGVSAL